jgi:hypothetical protein
MRERVRGLNDGGSNRHLPRGLEARFKGLTKIAIHYWINGVLPCNKLSLRSKRPSIRQRVGTKFYLYI